MKMMKALAVAAVGLAVGGFAHTAEASYSCSDSTYGTTGTYTATYGSTYSDCDANNSANANSTTVSAVAALQAAATQTAGIIANRVAGAVNNGSASFQVAQNGFSASTGKAAGDESNAPAVWVAGSWTRSDDNGADTASEGDIFTGLVGVDFEAADNVVLGISAGYEDSDFDTAYNGFGSDEGSLEGKGWIIAPYAAFDLGGVVASLSAGYTAVDYDTVRYDPSSGNRITGSTEADRYFVSAGLGSSYSLGNNFRLRSNASVFYASEEKDAFTETEAATSATISQDEDTTELGQAAVDFRLGYAMQQVEPYALVGASFDFAKSDVPLATGQTESGTQDDFAAKFGGGLILHMGEGVSGGIEAYTSEFREDYNEYNATANVRVKF